MHCVSWEAREAVVVNLSIKRLTIPRRGQRDYAGHSDQGCTTKSGCKGQETRFAVSTSQFMHNHVWGVIESRLGPCGQELKHSEPDFVRYFAASACTCDRWSSENEKRNCLRWNTRLSPLRYDSERADERVLGQPLPPPIPGHCQESRYNARSIRIASNIVDANRGGCGVKVRLVKDHLPVLQVCQRTDIQSVDNLIVSLTQIHGPSVIEVTHYQLPVEAWSRVRAKCLLSVERQQKVERSFIFTCFSNLGKTSFHGIHLF